MEDEKEVTTVEPEGLGALAVISRAEIDVQIATAKQYPRSIKDFRKECLDMVTLTEEIAGECIYALPRAGKTIEGPSARFAEIIVSAWGNCRAGARIVGEENEFIIAQGVFHDLQRNSSITFEVKRRIVDSKGRRFKPDMIGVTANAASSIAFRNAALKGIPKAFWKDMYDAARKTVAGDSKTLVNRRAEIMDLLQKVGATPEMVCEKLEVAGVADMGLESIVVLRGLYTAIKEGDTTVEMAFGPDTEDKAGGAADVMGKFQGQKKPEEKKAPTKKEAPPKKEPAEKPDEKYEV